MNDLPIELWLSGLAIAVVGFLWLVIRAFRTRILWGLGLLLLPPLAFVFIARQRRQVLLPGLVLFVGLGLFGVPYGMTLYEKYIVGFPERERIVEGELHLTLTGWDRPRYYILETKPETVVLQMANPDVTDQTLAYLDGMTGLRELDLKDTQITDAGLEVLAKLPRLEKLWLRKTRITDAGFRRHLEPMPSLKMLDLQETAVASETIAAWKKAQPGRRVLR